jgi:hypothetical protein
MATEVEDGTTCCYALQDKVWVTGPGGERWEVYTVLADAGAELEGRTHLDAREEVSAVDGCCEETTSECCETGCC